MPALALAAMVVGLAAHTLVTALCAAPTRLAQRRVAGDEAVMAPVLDRAAPWQALRAAINVARGDAPHTLPVSLDAPAFGPVGPLLTRPDARWRVRSARGPVVREATFLANA